MQINQKGYEAELKQQGIAHILKVGLAFRGKEVELASSLVYSLLNAYSSNLISKSNNMFDFTGKSALVTGATRGIGKAIALQLGQLGAQIVGTATSEAGVKQLQADLAAAGIQGKALLMNLQDIPSMEAAVQTTQTELGGLDILVNSAGIRHDNLVMRMKTEEWDEVISANLSAVFHLSKAVLRPMMKARFGRVISVSSVVGLTGNFGQANYTAAKAGLIGFSKTLAQETASRNITVNVVAPGFIDTDMTRSLTEEQKSAILGKIPAGRMGLATDIAAIVCFLASDAAGYITGETVHVNGGMYMS